MTKKNDEYIKSITGGQGVIDAQTGELRSTFDILQDLSKAWENLTSVEKQELTETVAGKTQRALFTALMTNFSTAVGATEAALNSEGSALEENNKRMNSLEGKTKQLQSAWQDFARNTINSEGVKAILSLGTQILKLADTDLGRLVIALVAAKVAMFAFSKAFPNATLGSFIGQSKILTQTILTMVATFKTGTYSMGIFKSAAYATAAGVGTLTKALIASPLFGVAAAGLAIYGIIKATNALIPRMEELEKNTEESTSGYNEASKETENYKNNLEEVNKKISELKEKGKLSITDEKDLSNLEKQKSALEADVKLAEQLEEAKKSAAQIDIMTQMGYKSNNIFDFIQQDEVEKSIENAKKLLKDAGNDISKNLGGNRENIIRETQDMANAYKALGEEVKKQQEKIANSGNMSQKEAEKEKEKLNELRLAYSDLGQKLNASAQTYKEWYKVLIDGGEETKESAQELYANLKNIGDTIGVDLVSSLNDSSEAIDENNEKIEEANKLAEQYQSALDGNIDSMINYGSNMDLLKTAQDELANSGAITAETFKSLTENNLLGYLDEVNGKLTVNTTAFTDSTTSIKENALANLQASTYEQIRAIVLEDLRNKEVDTGNEAQNAANKLEQTGNSAANMGKQLIAAAGDAAQLNTQLAAIAGKNYTPSSDASAKIDEVLKKAQKTQTFINKWKPSSSKRATKKASSGKKKSSKETYKAEVDTLYKYENALDNAKDAVDKLNDALKNTDNFNEREKYLKQLINATKDEIEATNDLRNAQTRQINNYIKQLRKQGFQISYNSKTNELNINNMERLGKFSGDTAKNLEKMIKKIQDLNKDNRSLSGSVRDLNADIEDFNEQLEELPTEKLEKFNELMEKFQQSRLDQIQNQIDDIQHEMENDPRLKALEAQIEALEKQNDELDSQKELEEKILAVEQAKDKLANQRKNKTIQIYREGQGFVWESDISAIQDAADELKDAQDELNDKIKQDQLDQLNAEKEALENSYQNRIDALQNFLDDQNYLIDKANREGIQTFEELQKQMAKFGLDNAENLKKATDWLNNYNKSLGDLNQTVNGILSSSTIATDGLIYSSGTQDRINNALSSIIPNIDTSTGLTLSNLRTEAINKDTTSSIYINSIELPNVKDIDDFIKALKDLPRMASSQATTRK